VQDQQEGGEGAKGDEEGYRGEERKKEK